MNIKKQSAGVWVNLIAAILALASLKRRKEEN